ncbi:MAG: FlgD immunoglobulin-like domain containing protein [Candidatus Eisenbacteria bacterium]
MRAPTCDSTGIPGFVATLALIGLCVVLSNEARADLGGDWGLTLEATQYGSIEAIAMDAQGNHYISGSFEGTIQIGNNGPSYQSPSDRDVFVAMLSPTGDHIWSTISEGAGDEGTADLAILPDGSVAVVGFTFSNPFGFQGSMQPGKGMSDAWGAVFSPTGSLVWVSVWGGESTDSATTVAVNVSGQGTSTIIGGHFRNTVDFGLGSRTSQGQDDWFLLEHKSAGPILADAVFGGTASELNCNIDVDDAGSVFLLGSSAGPLDLGNGPLSPKGSFDIVLAKLPGVGSLATWSQRFGSVETDHGNSIVLGEDGTIYVGGAFSGAIDLGNVTLVSNGARDGWIAAFDPAGGFGWAQSMGGSGEDRVSSVATEGSVLAITGNFSDTATFGPFGANAFDTDQDVFVATLDTDGNWLNFGIGSGPDSDSGLDIALHGWPVVVGGFFDRVKFGTFNFLDQTGGFEGYLVHLTESSSSVPGAGPTGPAAQMLEAFPAQPNPFRGETVVSFRSVDATGSAGSDASARATIRVTVHDIVGRVVRTLAPALAGDSGTVTWDGRDRAGLALPSGVYYIRLATPLGSDVVPVTIQR